MFQLWPYRQQLSIFDFRLGRLLGRGGFGSVYEASLIRNTGTSGLEIGRRLAIKLVIVITLIYTT